ncbi:hypothetical protein [Parenemella sanctibonifatiensis]|uniref:Uncharacterized protein n=1 Tax=Parenemella sanctibonifatiensis TaxID=2016505 RepID=A0A255E1B2_9ACTN|nr:hypothetical protein [Parenemella sanctibonifatiensis]OYN85348.1 hypothetical protein CGZ92_11160 [Parenemella sanctibonifatiensis]
MKIWALEAKKPEASSADSVSADMTRMLESITDLVGRPPRGIRREWLVYAWQALADDGAVSALPQPGAVTYVDDILTLAALLHLGEAFHDHDAAPPRPSGEIEGFTPARVALWLGVAPHGPRLALEVAAVVRRRMPRVAARLTTLWDEPMLFATLWHGGSGTSASFPLSREAYADAVGMNITAAKLEAFGWLAGVLRAGATSGTAPDSRAA